jgi:hypothetical protein
MPPHRISPTFDGQSPKKNDPDLEAAALTGAVGLEHAARQSLAFDPKLNPRCGGKHQQSAELASARAQVRSARLSSYSPPENLKLHELPTETGKLYVEVRIEIF